MRRPGKERGKSPTVPTLSWKREMEKGPFEELSRRVLSLCSAGGAEVLLFQKKEGLCRFAGNRVIQNLSAEDFEIGLRVFLGRRTGQATGNRVDGDSLKLLVQEATQAARSMPEREDALPLPGPQAYRKVKAFSGETWDLHPEVRVERIDGIIGECRRRGFHAAGLFSTGGRAIAVANSRGLFAFHRETRCTYSVTVASPDSSGWAEASGWDARTIPYEEVDARALRKAMDGQKPAGLDPGRYTVVLEPRAVSSLVLPMAYYAFGALPFHEGRSFISRRMGRRVLGEEITIEDDPYSPPGIGIPFDFEGMPRKRVALIEDGVARGVVYDRKSAKRWGKKTTGHAQPQPSSTGPVPSNLVLKPGKSSLEELVSGTERGVLVTQFHYVNLMDPRILLLTGVTRNGTFFIEKGRLTRALKNLRFTESVVHAFNRVDGVSREAVLCSGFFGGTIAVPGMRIREFNFTSATAF